MILLVGYHGTNSSNCQSILASKVFRPSKGVRHWLGDGVYFFEQETEAVAWVNRYGSESAILEADIQVENNMYFNIADSEEDRECFVKIAKRILDEADLHQIQIDQKNKIDGFVVNFIYNKFFQFHVIKGCFAFPIADFKEYATNIYNTPVSRLMKIQTQYCVRNSSCIVNIKEKKYHD